MEEEEELKEGEEEKPEVNWYVILKRGVLQGLFIYLFLNNS